MYSYILYLCIQSQHFTVTLRTCVRWRGHTWGEGVTPGGEGVTPEGGEVTPVFTFLTYSFNFQHPSTDPMQNAIIKGPASQESCTKLSIMKIIYVHSSFCVSQLRDGRSLWIRKTL